MSKLVSPQMLSCEYKIEINIADSELNHTWFVTNMEERP